MSKFSKERLLDMALRAVRSRFYVESHFLTVEEQDNLRINLKKLPSVHWKLFGGYDTSQRKVAVFYDMPIEEYVPAITFIHITPINPKYSQPLNHRDYMGSILGLGIERDVLGDILVHNNECIFICKESMKDFFLENISQVKHTYVKGMELLNREILVDFLPKQEELMGNIASTRLDLIVAWLASISRTQAETYIRNGCVQVNGCEILDKGKQIQENTQISVRGKGKFIFDSVVGKSKKERLIVKGYRFV